MGISVQPRPRYLNMPIPEISQWPTDSISVETLLPLFKMHASHKNRQTKSIETIKKLVNVNMSADTTLQPQCAPPRKRSPSKLTAEYITREAKRLLRRERINVMKSTDFVQLDRAMLKPQMRAISSREAKERCIHINSALPRKQVSSMFEKLPEISNLHSVDPYQFSKSFYDRPPDVQPYCHATGLQAGEKSWRSMAKQRRDWGQLYEPSLAAGRKALPPVMMYTGAKAPGMHKTHSCLFKPQCPLPDRDSFFQGQDFETIAILPTVSVSRQQAVVDDLDIKLRVAEMSRNSKNQLSKLETIVRQKTERDARFTLLKGKTYAMECRMLQDTITENVESQNYDEMSKVKRRDMQVFLDKSRKGLVFLNVIPTNLELASV